MSDSPVRSVSLSRAAQPAAATQSWCERHQLWLYLAAIAVAGALGLVFPQAATSLEYAVSPALALLMFATFAGLPLNAFLRFKGRMRFLGVLLILNGVIAPAIAFGLSRFVAGDPVLVFGILLVLLLPCVDYVVTFTGIAGGNSAALLAATPMLLIAQVLMLPVYLWVFIGEDAARVTATPALLEAFWWVVLVPLLVACALQWTGQFASQLSARSSRPTSSRTPGTHHAIPSMAGSVLRASEKLMVPIMLLNLGLIVYVQIAVFGNQLSRLLPAMGIFGAFAILMFGAGVFVSRILPLNVPDARAATFSGITRNSLVILPVALALPATYALVPAVVVSQTLVEILAMLVCVVVVPRTIRQGGGYNTSTGTCTSTGTKTSTGIRRNTSTDTSADSDTSTDTASQHQPSVDPRVD